MRHPGSPDAVRSFGHSPPPWLVIRSPVSVSRDSRLDPGEAAAIALAEELRADTLLLDERDGRRAARERGLQVFGTLGVLERAARLDLIDLPRSIDRLRRTNFHIREDVLLDILRRDRSRGSRGDGGA